MFAMGNSYDYVSMAAWNAKRIQRFLNVSVSLVTDQDIEDPVFDQVIKVPIAVGTNRYFADVDGVVAWHNHNRCDALDLSPYDRTLLLDADYVVNSDALQPVMQHGADVMCFRRAFDAMSGNDLEHLNRFGAHHMPMWWATVVIFNRGNFARLVFDAWRMIRDNWLHYRNVYHIRDPLFRNDYALSIALGITSGHTLRVDEIPWRLATLMPETDFEFTDDLEPTFQIQQHARRLQWRAHDMHVMSKQRLGEIIASAA